MALHKQEANKPKKQYPANLTLYPNVHDKFLIQYNKQLKCWRVVHYSKWGFRGQWSIHGVRTGKPSKNPAISTVRRNEWEYQHNFENEIDALEFAKEKAKQRKMENPIFLLQMDA